ncbi:dCTP deaminase [Candidatus Microgenomates bacterium]|nr:dCTP deaminase [Candidatus Microgenomates bacterium]
MVLSDKSIKELIKSKKLVVTPFAKSQIQPSSYNLRLANTFRIFKNTKQAFLDTKKPVVDFMELITVEKDEPIMIHPGEFVLGETREYFEFPNDVVGRLEGKSSLARIGIIIHTTAGFFDPGFKGTATLEITNLANIPIALYPDMLIAQMSFLTMTTPAEFPYGSKELGSKYQKQSGPTASLLFRDFKKSKT